MIYRFIVRETGVTEMLYTVEASNLAEACKKAKAGDTVTTEELEWMGVKHIEIIEEA